MRYEGKCVKHRRFSDITKLLQENTEIKKRYAKINSFGQICFKKASNYFPTPSLKDFASSTHYLMKVVAVPWIWLGLAVMAVELVTWLLAIAQADLNFVYPIGSLYYVFIFVMSRVFLGERIDRTKLFGTFLIGIGIIIIHGS